jgi:hypothetical protein
MTSKIMKRIKSTIKSKTQFNDLPLSQSRVGVDARSN